MDLTQQKNYSDNYWNEEENVKIEETLGKVYVDARFDKIPNSFMETPLDLVVLIEFLSLYGLVLRSTYGDEISWKSKKPHCHYRAELQLEEGKKKIPKGSFSQNLKYWLNKKNISVEKFFFKIIIPKNDLETFFQYPLKDYKEYDDIEQDCQCGFTETEHRELWIRAKENRRIALELFEKHETKKNNEILEYDKLRSFIDKNLNDYIVLAYQNEVAKRYIDPDMMEDYPSNYMLGTFKRLQSHIGTLIIKYYIEEHDAKVPYGNKIVSLFNRYCIHKNILKAEDLASIIFKL